MRIAFLCHRLPYPPNKGDKARAFQHLRALAERGHITDLFTLADDPADLQHSQSLSAWCNSVTVRAFRPAWARIRALRFLPTRQPLTLPYFYSADLSAAISDALRTRTYDRIFVYCSAMAQYVKNTGDIPVIADIVDVDSDKWRQYASHVRFPWSWIYRREAVCLAGIERSICRTAAATIVTTEREARLLRDMCGETARVHVVPNGVGEPPAVSFDPAQTAAEPTVVFTGDMAYFANANAVDWFARQTLPLLREKAPGTRFLIVGRNPGRSVRALASLPGVEVTGTVPDVGVYLARAHVSVAPFLMSAGIPTKILEAMSCGLPVVATSRGVQGLVDEVASVVTKADSPDGIASAIAALLRDRELAQRAGAEGRRAVMAAYQWKRSFAQLLDLIEHPARAPLPRAHPSVA